VNMTGASEAVVRVSVKGLETKSFTIPKDNLSCINAAEGYKADVITESLTITVRAPEDILDKIQANNLWAVADLSEIGANPGVFNPSVKIRIDGFPEAGVIGEYAIHVTMSKG